MLTDLMVGAVNLALERARQLAQEEIARATGGLPAARPVRAAEATECDEHQLDRPPAPSPA